MRLLDFTQQQRAKSYPPESWTWTWTPGASLANFFALYDSLGTVTISSPSTISTTLDGPIQVARYGTLTVNSSLTASQRCRGLMPIADVLNVGASGSISMTGMGAVGSSIWAISRDIFVPASITFTGANTSLQSFLGWIRKTGYCIFDPSLYASPPPGMGDITCDWATWTAYGGTSIISAAGCGAGGAGIANATGGVGNTGVAGSNGGLGGGGCGGMNPGANFGTTLSGGPSRVWGGGVGSGGWYPISGSPFTGVPDLYGGKGGIGCSVNTGGGAGNPSGNNVGGSLGTGGVLIVICRGPVNLTAGHALSANGMPGENATNAGGGGSGGGSVSLFYSGILTGTPNLTATGGAGGTGSYAGGPGGAGSTQVKTFATMGW